MASLNRKSVRRTAVVDSNIAYNAEGSAVRALTPIQELRRTVAACMLWEDNFYESGVSIADRISSLVLTISRTDPDKIAALAIEVRELFKLRHVPLLIVRELARSTPEAKKLVSETLSAVIQRPDELGEFLSIYWKGGKQPLSAQVKKGLAIALGKFNEYSLAKYNRKTEVSLKDVVRLVHPKPTDRVSSDVLGRLLKDELATPDTWEVALSAGKDKNETFTRLIKEEKLGALALLRNLRNMEQSGVDRKVIASALEKMDVSRVLPYRFIAAAKYAPSLEPYLEKAMFRALEGFDKLPGRTALVIDRSGSMNQPLSNKSDLSRLEVASALAILARELCEDSRLFVFGESAAEIPARRGFAIRDAIRQANVGGSSFGGKAVDMANAAGYDRIIVLTDGQWHSKSGMGNAIDISPTPLTNKAYMLNVGTDRNGVGYGRWFSIDGFSEAVLKYIWCIESMEK
jgi:60 kDa SS-A/Ro ribonucleoprotein